MISSSLKSGLVGLLLGLSVSCSSSIPVSGDNSSIEQKVDVRTVRLKAGKLWDQGKIDAAIKLYLSLSKASDIMGDSVEYVTYDAKTKTNNYEKLVNQLDVPKEKRKPVFVLYYDDVKNKGAALVTLGIKRIFGNKMRYIGFERNVDPHLVKNNYTPIIRKYGLTGCPSQRIYSPWDVVKGETKDNNDGILKSVSTLPGNPNTIKAIKNIIGVLQYCVNMNIFKPRKDYTYRLPNRGKWEKLNLNRR